MAKLPSALFACCLAALFAAGDSGAEVTQRAPDHCREAYTIFGWAKMGDAEKQAKRDEEVWDRVGLVMQAPHRRFLKIVDDSTPAVTHEVSFRQYEVQGHPGAAAYVGQCGHGGTCNYVADVFHGIYKGVGIPLVYCGRLPAMLVSPKKPTIPPPDKYKDMGGEEDLDAAFDESESKEKEKPKDEGKDKGKEKPKDAK
ncbi:MAG: hypothetical protein HY744_30125 [Deltaproteobacteria bacterium]|nr:hypothetical protein [Deltaproteobacteria bacterium]